MYFKNFKRGICVIGIFCFLLLGCKSKKQSITFLIPNGYTGWVNLVFEDNESNYKPLLTDSGYIYKISMPADEFKVGDEIFPSGKYELHFYYYNANKLALLSWNDYPEKNIEIAGTRNIHNDVKTGLLPNPIYSFYVSERKINCDSLYIDKLPENRLFPIPPLPPAKSKN